ncbi:hypothetical protein MMC10_008565 [Thelotrema lepadinum]|nr:hypothetical protein [Thelotrema lepadinum]
MHFLTQSTSLLIYSLCSTSLALATPRGSPYYSNAPPRRAVATSPISLTFTLLSLSLNFAPTLAGAYPGHSTPKANQGSCSGHIGVCPGDGGNGLYGNGMHTKTPTASLAQRRDAAIWYNGDVSLMYEARDANPESEAAVVVGIGSQALTQRPLYAYHRRRGAESDSLSSSADDIHLRSPLSSYSLLRARTIPSVPGANTGGSGIPGGSTKNLTPGQKSAMDLPFLQNEKKFQNACDANGGKCPSPNNPKYKTAPAPPSKGPPSVGDCSGAPGVCPDTSIPKLGRRDDGGWGELVRRRMAKREAEAEPKVEKEWWEEDW